MDDSLKGRVLLSENETLIFEREKRIGAWLRGVRKSLYIIETHCPHCHKLGQHELVFMLPKNNKCECIFCRKSFVVFQDSGIRILGTETSLFLRKLDEISAEIARINFQLENCQLSNELILRLTKRKRAINRRRAPRKTFRLLFPD